jgi:tetratricopeptide (TPR) repeat protein
MNRLQAWLALGFLLVCGAAALAQTGDALANRDALATAAYRSDDLSTARILWEEELQAVRDSADENQRARLCYNLGNLALRENHPLDAVAWFSASLRLRPRDSDTWSNLELARLNAGLDAADRGDLAATMDRLLTSWSKAESSWLALFGVLPLALALAFEALRGGRAARWLVALGLLVGALCGTPWLWNWLQAGNDPVMIVASENARALSEPRSDAPRVLELEAGEVLMRSDQTPGWVEVEAADGQRGWLRAEQAFALNR